MATGEDCNSTVAQFVKKQLRLLEMERQAEIAEVDSLLATHSPKELERLGLCIRNLRVASVSTGMGGRRLIKLVRAEREGAPLPPTRLGPGDIVSVKTPAAANATVSSSSSSSSSSLSSPASSSSAEHQQAQLSGVVVKIREGSLTIASDADRDDGSDTLILTVSEGDTGLIVTQMGNDVTYKRMKEALALISSGCAGLNRMQHAILGLAPVHGPSSAPISSPGEEKALHKAGSDRSSLNAQQQEAVEFALRTEDVALIHGPPGTGKTTTVAELVRRLVVEHGRRVLVCAPSNVAVDNIGEKLAPLIVPHSKSAKHGDRMVRIGHPARVLPSVSKMTLDSKLARTDGADVIRDIRQDISRVRTQIQQVRDKGQDFAKARELRTELRELGKDLRVREARVLGNLLDSAAVILATTTGAGDRVLAQARPFDWVVIDEAAQALEAACWIPILKGAKLVLAGDDKQLPPTIKSDEAAKEGLSVTLFERLHAKFGKRITRMLTVQYRMNKKIMEWASKSMYNSELCADPSVADHVLADLPGVKRDVADGAEFLDAPLFIADTVGCGFYEECDAGLLGIGDSKRNPGEGTVVVEIVEKLLGCGVSAGQIGVITPYQGQVGLLRGVLAQYSCLEVGTVDGFQGREKEAIVFSMVRSNDKKEVGFLKEDRRTNVAITRAKRFVCVVCDSETVSAHPFLKSAVEYFTEEGEFYTSPVLLSSSFSGDFSLQSPSQPPRRQPQPSQSKDKKRQQQKAQPYQQQHKKKQQPAKQQQQDSLRKNEGEMVPQAQRGYSKSTEDEIEKYKEMVNTFSKNVDGSDTLQLPASLTSYVRLQIHEYAATIPGITHGSEGEGKSRHIVIRRVAKKKPKPAENTEPPMEKDKKANNQSDVEGAVVMAEATSDVVATAPTTVVPEEDKSRKPQKKTQKQQQQQQQPKKKAKGPKESFPANASKPKKAGPVKAVAKTKGMDEIDAALAELKIDTDTEHCAYRDSKTKKRCQQKVTLIYATCRYCNKKFCYAHVQAEVHGCGAAAKRLARAQVKEQYNEMTKYKKLAEKKGIY